MSLTTSPIKRKQIVDEIAKNIKAGKLKPGTRLATVREMSTHFNVSLSVVQGAMRELINDGMIECVGAGGFYVKSSSSAQKEVENKSPRPVLPLDGGRVFLTCNHHSDLMWRRTFDEYAKVRKKQIDLLLEYAKKYSQFHFFFDQSEVVRVYLSENPDKVKELKKLVDAGRVELAGGLCIPDLNMCNGESLLRNLLSGRRYYLETFGVEVKIASMIDAFGMCSQLPQVLLKAGYNFLIPGRIPGFPREFADNRPFLWDGLDGSKITTSAATACIAHSGYSCNVPVQYPSSIRLAQTLSAVKKIDGDVMAHYMTEECLIEEDVIWIMESVNRNAGKPVEFGRIYDFFERIDRANLPVISGEFNPTFTGCYTTRIGIKKLIRKAENILFNLEALASHASLEIDTESLWRELNISQFHDAICGCHTDIVASELQEKLGDIINTAKKFSDNILKTISKGGITIFNSDNFAGTALVSCKTEEDFSIDGIPTQRDGDKVFFVADIPPCGVSGFTIAKKTPSRPKIITDVEKYSFKTDFFNVKFNNAEPLIAYSSSKHNIIGQTGFGEILFRFDHGSMWTEVLETENIGREQQKEELDHIVEGDVFIKVVSKGEVLPQPATNGNSGTHWPGFGKLSFRKEYIFLRALNYFKLKLFLDWTGYNTKISIRFPVNLNIKEAVATYDVPFGAISRKPYFEVPYEYESSAKFLDNADYKTAKGDWPALNWVDYSDSGGGMAIANSGTPGHQVVGDNIIVSLLRSGTHCADGAMVPQPGAHDNGVHEFEFAFRPHISADLSSAVELGSRLNRPPTVHISKSKTRPIKSSSLIYWNADNVVLSSLRRSASCHILRVYETLGRPVKVEFHSSRGKFKMLETDFEEKNDQAISEKSVQFRPFEIKTFKIKFER